MIQNSDEINAASLRKKAERICKQQPLIKNLINSEADSLKLIHELQVHQIELEMQNEELRVAQRQAVIATERYIELYDFAPSVFITLSMTGKIDKITLRGAKMLNKDRADLFYYKFENFVTEDSKAVFQEFFKNVFISKKHEVCEVALITENNSLLYVQIDSVISENFKQCYMSVTDITVTQLAKLELIVANQELVYQNSEKEKRAAELVIANAELVFQNSEKEKRAAELVLANAELVFQNSEKEKRAAEHIIANRELSYQNSEKENRAAELVIANAELVYQNSEKENRAAELVIANAELVYQNSEKENRAAELDNLIQQIRSK